MPQVDLETLVSACASVSCDKKIACETLANTTNNKNPNQENFDNQPEIPPESFWLSKDEEFDWFDRNAFYERKDSQKGNSKQTGLNPNPSSTSQRFPSTALKIKALITGLPKPQQKFDPKLKRNCKAATTNLFPMRTGSVGKSDGPLCEPSSPEVSCMGRVRSKRDQRRLKNRQGSGSESVSLRSKPERKQKAGLFSSFKTIFRSKKGSESKTRKDSSSEAYAQWKRVESTPPRKSVASEPRRSVDGEPAGLGGMKRFISGRRSDSWIGDVA